MKTRIGIEHTVYYELLKTKYHDHEAIALTKNINTSMVPNLPCHHNLTLNLICPRNFH